MRVDANNLLRPDIAIATAATGKIWLVAEVVSSEDHHADTVEKKQIYETMKLPRLWMIDPRYKNVEVYHATEYGMRLEHILAGSDVLTEKLLPKFQLAIADLFASNHT
jgi:Uma2 family endonuclease